MTLRVAACLIVLVLASSVGAQVPTPSLPPPAIRPPVKPVVEKLPDEDIVNLVAFMASRQP